MEVTASEFETPTLYEERKLDWTEVLGSDSHHPEGESEDRYPGSQYTWVKMAEPTLEGLRLALLDGGSFSIRRSDASDDFDPFARPNHCIESIEIHKARYMGRGQLPARLDFNPWLNAMIGGRGTGKSTVLHALRLAARRDSDFEALPAHSESRETFKRFNQVPSDQTKDGGLTNDTKIQWTLIRDGVRHRVRWQENGTRMIVEDESKPGEWLPSSVQAVTSDRFPIQLFSQGQIAELAGVDPTALLREIDRTAGIAELHGRLAEAVAAFESTRAAIRALDSRFQALEDPTALELQDVDRKLARFEAADHTTVFTAYRQRQRQRHEVDRQFEAAEQAAQDIDATAETLHTEDLPDGLFDQASDENRQVINVVTGLRAALETARQQSREVAQNLRHDVVLQRQALTDSKWALAETKATQAYRELEDSLATEGVTDPTSTVPLCKRNSDSIKSWRT